jgi:alanine racemase
MSSSIRDSTELSATVATIRIESLLHNLSIFRDATTGINLMAVVKADAYGHGSISVSHALVGAGVTFLAVATVAEAIELREAGISVRILVLGVPRRVTASLYGDFNLEASITNLESIDVFTSTRPVRAHLNLDTGMGRVGIQAAELASVLEAIHRSRSLELFGVTTHFANAGEPESDFTRTQWDRFKDLLARFEHAPTEIHAASSSAAFTLPESVRPDFVNVARIGVGLYGLLDLPRAWLPSALKPVMTLTSEVSHVKVVAAGTPISYGGTWRAKHSTRIATVSAGYADGVPRHLSNRGVVHIGEKRFPIVGVVCMDMFMIDIGPADEMSADCRVGDVVTIFGEGGPSAIEIARMAGTIPYEIVCGVGARVPRIYITGT